MFSERKEKLKFIHTGDIHLGAKFSSSSIGSEKGKIRREEIWGTFKRMVDFAVEENISLILISGDLYEESYFTHRDMRRLNEIISTAKDVQFVIIAGNHDRMSPDSIFFNWNWSDNVTLFEEGKIQKKLLDDLGVVVHGASWTKASNALDMASALERERDYFNILMLHGDVMGNSKYMSLAIHELRNLSMDYVALGHIHKPMFLEKNIAYCGSLEGLDFGETGERGFILGILDDTPEFEFIPFSRRIFMTSEILVDGNSSQSEVFLQALEAIDRSSRQYYHRIILKGTRSLYLELETLKSELEEVCYHIEVLDETIPDIDIEQLAVVHNDNIIGSFIKSFDDKIDDKLNQRALYLGILALLEGGEDL
jgi:DNA repair exonuclease SbcCD nuclease subunit